MPLVSIGSAKIAVIVVGRIGSLSLGNISLVPVKTKGTNGSCVSIAMRKAPE